MHLKLYFWLWFEMRLFLWYLYTRAKHSHLIGWLTFIYIFICEVRKIEAVYFELGYLTYVAVLVVF